MMMIINFTLWFTCSLAGITLKTLIMSFPVSHKESNYSEPSTQITNMKSISSPKLKVDTKTAGHTQCLLSSLLNADLVRSLQDLDSPLTNEQDVQTHNFCFLSTFFCSMTYATCSPSTFIAGRNLYWKQATSVKDEELRCVKERKAGRRHL